MYILMTILIIIAALLLIGVVLLQPGKGDLTATFGGISSQIGSAFGMQRANNLLVKVTIWLAAIVIVLSVLTNVAFVEQPTFQGEAPVTEGAQVQTETQNLGLPPVQQEEAAPAAQPTPQGN